MQHPPSRVTDPEATRFDTTNGSWTDNQDVLGLGEVQNFPRMSFGNALSDQGNAPDLGVLEDLQGRGVDAPGTGKVDDNVNIWVFRDGLIDRGVDREQSLLGTPIELLNMVSAEWVDHGSNRSRGTTARVIEIKHPLDGTGLEAIHE